MSENEQYAEMYFKQGIPRPLGFFPDHKLRAKNPTYMFLSDNLNTRLEEDKSCLVQIYLFLLLKNACQEIHIVSKPLQKQ